MGYLHRIWYVCRLPAAVRRMPVGRMQLNLCRLLCPEPDDFARADEMLDQIDRRDVQKRHKAASAWKGSVPACGASLRLMCNRRKTARFSVAMLYYYTIFFPDKTV